MTEEYKDISASMPNGVGAVLFESLESTNDSARALAASGDIGPKWVAARTQTKGRGRLGRKWISEAGGNLYTSLLFKPDIRPDELMALPFITALAVRDALIKSGVPAHAVQCKWPNDVLINEHKCAGILIESMIGAEGRLDAVIVGIGVNLVSHPPVAKFPPTSVKKEIGSAPEPEAFLAYLAQAFIDQWVEWLYHGFTSIAASWMAVAWGIGAHRVVETQKERVSGTLLGLAEDGALVIKLDEGGEKRLYAGDVFPAASGS